MILRAALAAIPLAVSMGIPAVGDAQAYPTKPIRVLVGFPPGGGADVAARILGSKLAETSSYQFIVDNRPGAGSAIASDMAAKAAPDGYTLIMIGSSHAVNAGFQKKPPFDPVKDFAGVMLVATAPVVLITHPSMPVKSLQELMAMARAKPGTLNFASAGSGGINHLAGELLKRMANIELTHVPYRGVALALPAVISGEVQLLFSSLPGALGQIKAGKVKALAVTSARRSAVAPEIPTIAESGVPGYEANSWYGMLAPAATPRPIVVKLNADLLTALRAPDVTAAIIGQGADPRGSTPAEFDRYLATEVTKWTKLISEAGLRPE